jgi:hypothetical protein
VEAEEVAANARLNLRLSLLQGRRRRRVEEAVRKLVVVEAAAGAVRL